ncbi:YrrS family protein [Listeria cossartiae subsp. cayugensis]|uniref:YrrS family protein n=1 Tax=Listeria cossartiae subsp. cayugensis TaxID=2713505 RepID=A0ABU2IK84_9LIST|nr:YrrS family protein [Listeria cossartiae]MDS9999912.1 YrrS family protein [Listeria cossartiae subsp. cayugensis]MDT0003117.1 YrrS family protein [Listeria cossartiae subsp. cayugensis]MDT0007641.1 YrrS family protein [Listeria cossartiae subsp. cayugensis]MDT0013075.1 YrrS family protein [Listeria cossartiae subsp. cayugensis]MDT0018515.1 YrrS family protein [Listeria cossartiae subsp. cayugensis]
MADKRQSNNRRIKQNLVEGSRSQQNTKRKKTNLVLNVLIIVVSLLIIGSLYFVLFKTESDPAQQENKTASSTSKKEDAAKSDKSSEKEKESSDEKTTETTESDDPNVAKVITKDWKPIGTDQTGDHVNSYSSTSVDWQEKRKAFSAATDIPISNTSLWFVEQGADPATQSIGTLSTKEDPDKAYRVYITWVDGEGWQPTKVEELKTNDKR